MGRRPFIFAIDEAASMLQGDNSKFIAWRRVIAAFKENVFFLLADTSSKVSNFAPSSYRDPSDRVYLGGKLYPIIYLLPNIGMVDFEVKGDAKFDLKVEANIDDESKEFQEIVL